MVRYTLLRLLIFFGVLLTLSLFGLRDNPVLLIGLSALISAAIAYALLRGMRDEMTTKLMERHEAKLRAKEAGRPGPSAFAEDEAAEDAEVDQAGRTDGTDPAR
ncbi:DUF4229 domain-containing protein [Intrasporangium calvum]|uniref:DUF4229 domain-containing protein n=1 Tax=Intrasporangium calvum TaxID=53358 RepID=A0ABT5GDU5_9MICO|nr:DUF4229 domain-containing protein [Intrasporangium calvum]MDC5696434.1 DUF4229 domain-containing protein [Intrasporangium calvum]